MVHYARQIQSLAARLQAAEAETARLREEMARRDAQAKRQKVMHQYARELTKLAQQGVEVDVDEEVKDAQEARMTVPQMQRHLTKVARHYGRSPVGGGLISTDFPVAGRERAFGEREKKAALAYQAAHGCTWSEAMAAVTK